MVSRDRPKDPERVRLGRLGALTLHASGKTNTGPARAAWEARLAAEAGIAPDLPANERKRRMDYAIRARMLRLNEARWAPLRPVRLLSQASRILDRVERLVDPPPEASR